jgi:pimeloyl-ACP methyl ester carboxylesterase
VCAAVGRYCRCGRTERATVSALATAALATTPLTTAIGFLPSLRDWDRTDALGDVRARTVVVSGGNDLLTPVAHAEELAAGIPGASHLHVPEAGHMLPQQAPEVLKEAIRAVISAPSVAPLTASPPAAVLRRAHA